MGQGDSRLLFKQRINQLMEKPIPVSDHEFWSVLFTTQLKADDMFLLIAPNDVRELRKHQPQNLCTIIYKSIEQLILFSHPSNVTSEYTSAKNSIRLLTRILPFVLETNDDGFVESFFWENTAPRQQYIHKKPRAAQQVTDEAAKKEGKGKEVVKEGTSTGSEEAVIDLEAVKFTELAGEPLTKPLAEVLVSTLMNAMFLPNFSVNSAQVQKHQEALKKQRTEEEEKKREEYGPLEENLLWENGIGMEKGITWTWDQISNRTEILKCLLACFSQTLYTKVEDIPRTPNKFLAIATSSTIPHTSTLFYSLLNTIAAYNPTGMLPYSSRLVSDPQEVLVTLALHVLSVLLDYKYMTGDQSEGTSNGSANVYISLLKNMKKPEDFAIVYNAIVRLLHNRIDAVNTYLPNSQKMISCHEEVLVLFWKFLDENITFRFHACKNLDITQALVPVLFFMQDAKRDQSKYAMVQMCSFILLILSGEREFGVALNKPFTQKVPMELPLFTGNYADLLILVFHKIIVNDKSFLKPMFDCLLTIICNISPYTKRLTMLSSVKLLNLFEAFAAKKFLYANEKNHQYVFLLLEALNNLIQYQYEGNVHVVYAILRRHTVFEELAKLPPLEKAASPSNSNNNTQPSDVNNNNNNNAATTAPAVASTVAPAAAPASDAGTAAADQEKQPTKPEEQAQPQQQQPQQQQPEQQQQQEKPQQVQQPQ
eukprot:GEZU01019543.1.p1 GENE.GEZU01019543.1~~GEZU01019543.1.p1  ORF type:complete len:709 (+),score=235.60 GEZU01019543.1:154-2280(+)